MDLLRARCQTGRSIRSHLCYDPCFEICSEDSELGLEEEE